MPHKPHTGSEEPSELILRLSGEEGGGASPLNSRGRSWLARLSASVTQAEGRRPSRLLQHRGQALLHAENRVICAGAQQDGEAMRIALNSVVNELISIGICSEEATQMVAHWQQEREAIARLHRENSTGPSLH